MQTIPLQRLFTRNPAGQKLGQIRSAQADGARARAGVGGRETRAIVVPFRRDRQPLVGADAERAAVREHRVLQRQQHFGPVRVVRVDQDRIHGGLRPGVGAGGGSGGVARARRGRADAVAFVQQAMAGQPDGALSGVALFGGAATTTVTAPPW